jgi:acyl-coenzyme A thioesterase PaaI-like protein
MEPMTLTSEMSIRFLRPARGEVIRARARIDSLGSRSIVGTVIAYTDDESKPVAVAQGTYMRPKNSANA